MVTWILALWVVVTFGFAVVLMWKSLVGRKEENVVILDPAEASIASEQRETVAKMRCLTAWAKGLGFASLGLLVLVGGISLFRALKAFGG